MSKVIGKIKRKPGSFVYVTKGGAIVEKSRSEMQKKRKKKARK